MFFGVETSTCVISNEVCRWPETTGIDGLAVLSHIANRAVIARSTAGRAIREATLPLREREPLPYVTKQLSNTGNDIRVRVPRDSVERGRRVGFPFGDEPDLGGVSAEILTADTEPVAPVLSPPERPLDTEREQKRAHVFE